MLVRLLPQIDEASLPADIEALERRRAEAERLAERKLELLREGLKAFAADWVRRTAKETAVAQSEHTLRLGRRGVARLKRRVEELAAELPAHVDGVLRPEDLDTGEASSGQVPLIIDRRFQRAIRSVLAELFPILARAGYQRSAHWFDADHGQLELPPDLRSLIDEIVEALAEAKVCEAKLRYFDRQSQARAAQRLWEGA
ncbi:MAG: hypothetical protein D6776_00850 [Planctomycetota bacterium]|nr:MAG: hypothetical protein D6776_00850 [Planctomycetota bacterium]